MYDLATITRLNDLAALKAQFPAHDCAEEVLYNPEYESFGDSYVDRDEARTLQDERDTLARTIEQIVADQQDRVNLDFDRWWAKDLLDIVAVNSTQVV